MPRATVNLADTERVDLKTLPATDEAEGGYVILRRLTYGQKIQRQQMSMEVSMQAQQGKGRNADPEMQMRMTQERVAIFDFASCIVDHNLEDDKGSKLDFKQAHNVFMLDPRVGEEIAMNIDNMNNFDEATLGNSGTGSMQPSSANGLPTTPQLNS